MWWEPWELSAGQVSLFAAVAAQRFGLMIHTNIGEVQRAVPSISGSAIRAHLPRLVFLSS